MKKLNLLLLSMFCWMGVQNSLAQCPELSTVNTAITPENCTPTAVPTNGSALNVTPYFSSCQSICVTGGTVDNGAGGTMDSCAPGGPSYNDDFWLFAADPYNGGNPYGIPGSGVAGYDGSLVISWQDYPGYPNTPPTLAVHVSAFVDAGFFTTQSICSDGFTEIVPVVGTPNEYDNVLCDGPLANSLDNNQIVAGAGTIPLGSDVNTNITYLNYYLQIIPNPAAPVGATNYCFDISPYKPGFICADALDVPLTTVSTTHVQGTYNDFCLCQSAANGGLYTNTGNTTYNPAIIDPWCPAGSSKSVAWFKVNAPYACNKIATTVTSGTGSYNITVLSNVSCPITSQANPFIAGQTIDVYTDSLNNDRVLEGGSCVAVGAAYELAPCTKTLAAGEYWICVSSEGPKNVFDLQIDVYDATPDAGTIDAATASICSGSPVTASVTGSNLPLLASCGQDIVWKYSTTSGFDPATTGTVIGNGTSVSTSSLTATGCATSTYYIIGYVPPVVAGGCTDLTGYKTVTVYPSLSAASYVITPSPDQCDVTITPACPSNLIGGLSSYTENSPGSGAWSSTAQTLTVSGAPAGCNSIVIPAQNLTCAPAVCTPPTVTITSITCTGSAGFIFTVNISGGTAGHTYTISDDDLSTNFGATALSSGASYTMGTYVNGTSVIITVTDELDNACTTNTSATSTPCVAPVITSTSASSSYTGSGSTVTLSAVISDPSAIGGVTTWYNATTGAVVGTGNVLNIAPTTTLCTSEVYTYYAEFNPAGTTYANTNTISSPETVTVFPLPSPTYSYSNGGCTVTADDSNCPGGGGYIISGGNTAGNIYDAANPSSGIITFTYTASDANNPVAPVTMDVNFACGGSCPTFVSAQSTVTGLACSGTQTMLSVTVSPMAALYQVEWVGPNGYFSTDFNPVVTLTNNKCFVQAQDYFYNVICIQDGSTIASGALSISVYPDPNYEVYGTNTCNVSVNSLCDPSEVGYFNSIYWGGDVANGNTFSTIVDGDNGTLTYTLEQASGCFFNIDVPYNCTGPCVPGANGVCTINEYGKTLPYICITSTSGITSSVALYDAVTGAGMSVADGHEVGFIVTDNGSYTAADFAAGTVPIISYQTPSVMIPNPSANFNASAIPSMYYNMPLYVYAVSLEAPFTAFQWSSSSCLKVSTPAEFIFLLPISASVSGTCVDAGDITFDLQGGLYQYNGTLPDPSSIVLTDGTNNYTAATITDLGGTPAMYQATFTGVAPSATGAYTLTVTDQNACTTSLNVDCALSIDWISFNGYIRDTNNALTWSTASEQDNDYFEIMRSTDGIHFETIAKIDAIGNTQAISQYTYTDKDVSDNYYYKINAVDTRGSKISTQIIYLARSKEYFEIITLKPIPTHNMLYVDLNSMQTEKLNIDIMDLTGKTLLQNQNTIHKGLNTISVPVQDLASGMYLIVFTSDNHTYQSKFLKN